MTWEEARRRCIDKWVEIQSQLEFRNPRDVRELCEKITTACAFCERAWELCQDAGKSPIKGNACPFCIIYRQYGGCDQVIGPLVREVKMQNWHEAQWYVTRILDALQRMKLPQEQPISTPEAF